ncbi:MAG: adenylate/guanylate cyclase domain-containing protein [Pseudanabaena frigida]|uniref:Adenylate/guanylate cyclase domain-containing protein n=1 Tax=Pseudanabaena frigida TaxID=945775 RepID=A0A2W4WHU9_9CYAN|nr:MAG: adenylate/guanylate cyclase domain-containing protein [Pseudanabaena frigida]
MITAITLLILLVVTAIIWLWATNETEFYRQQKIQQVESFAAAFGQTLQLELGDRNWANMRTKMNLIMQSNEDFVYVIVSDRRENHQIVSAAPAEIAGQFMPDLVPVSVSKAAVHYGQVNFITSLKARIAETYLLRDIDFPPNILRAKRGERIIEAAIDIPDNYKLEAVNGTFRVGITLRKMDDQIVNAVTKTLAVGAIALFLGIIAAYYLSWILSQPILRLRESASRLASGELDHRVTILSQDELGALGRSFNDMSDSLQASFGKLQKTLDSFERFVPEKFLQVIAPRGIENIAVGEYAKHNITILFSDIRGYTALSESQTPEETFKFLNEYIAYVGDAIDEYGGFIDKYIGDAVMALFDENHTDSALKAAIAMQLALKKFNQKREQLGLRTIASGIGIHRGEVVMGTVGFTSRIDSTVIGDAVNVSSRVEGLTKNYNCEILITDAVVSALEHPEDFNLDIVDESVKVKGKEMAIKLYRLNFD